MIYKFKSKAAGDVIMMGPAGDDHKPLLSGDLDLGHCPRSLPATPTPYLAPILLGGRSPNFPNFHQMAHQCEVLGV